MVHRSNSLSSWPTRYQPYNRNGTPWARRQSQLAPMNSWSGEYPISQSTRGLLYESLIIRVNYLPACTSAPYKSPAQVFRSLPTLSKPDSNFFDTSGANESFQHNRLCQLSLSLSLFSLLSSLLSSLLPSSLSSSHLKFPDPDSNAKFSRSPAAALQLLPHDRSKFDTTICCTLNPSFDWFKMCV